MGKVLVELIPFGSLAMKLVAGVCNPQLTVFREESVEEVARNIRASFFPPLLPLAGSLHTRVMISGNKGPEARTLPWILSKVWGCLDPSVEASGIHFLVDLNVSAKTFVIYVDAMLTPETPSQRSKGSAPICHFGAAAAVMESQSSSSLVHSARDVPSLSAQESQGLPSSPRNPSSPSATTEPGGVPCPLDRTAQVAATRHFDTFWRRQPDGAPLRWSQLEECWRPGVQAAVAATVLELSAQQRAPSSAQILSYMQEKAVRQYGEVTNGHNFKRPPSNSTLQRYRSLAAAWRERFQTHYEAGTVPDDIQGLLKAYSSLPGVPAIAPSAPFGGLMNMHNVVQLCSAKVQVRSPFLAVLSARGSPGKAFPPGPAAATSSPCKRPRTAEAAEMQGQVVFSKGSSLSGGSTESDQDVFEGLGEMGATHLPLVCPTSMQAFHVNADLAADMASMAGDVAQLLQMHVQANAQIDRLCKRVNRVQQQLHVQASMAEDPAFLFDDILSM